MRESDGRGKNLAGQISSLYSRPGVQLALKVVCFSLVYLLSVQLSLAIRYPGTPVTPMFLPNSIMLAVLLLTPKRSWWIYLLVVIPGHYLMEVPFSSPGWTTAAIVYDTVVALFSAWLITRFGKRKAPFETLNYVMIFTVLGVVVAITVMLSLTLGFISFLASMSSFIKSPWTGHFWLSWRRSFLSNSVPFLTVTPAIVLWVRNGKTWLRRFRLKTYGEAGLLVLGLLIACEIAFSGIELGPALLYLLLPFFIWAAVRFGPTGVSGTLVITAFLSVWSGIRGRGPFTAQSPEESVLGLQIFLVAASGSMLFLAALVEERKQTEKALRRNEERLKLALAAGRMATWDWDLLTNKMIWSHDIGSIFGGLDKNSDGNPDSLLDLIAPVDRTAFTFSVERTVENGIPCDIEFRAVRADGSDCWMMCKGRTEYDEAGHPVSLLGVVVDITERKNLEDELLRGERELGALVENSPDVVFRLDRNFRYTYISPAIERYTKVRQRDFVGKTVREIPVPGYDREGLMLSCREAFNRSCEVQREYTLEGRHYRTRLVPEFSSSREIDSLLGMTEDVTERKIAEETLRQNEKELRRSHDQIRELAGKLIVAQEEERSRISSELHDDLSQKLAALGISISNLKRQLPTSDETAIEQLNNVQKRVNRIGEDIRRMSHQLRPASLEHIGLGAALKSLIEEFSNVDGAKIGLSVTDLSEPIPDDIALCLYRVAQESLHNIAKHSGAKNAQVGLSIGDEGVSLLVHDDGCGFDPVNSRSRRGLGLVSMEERVRLMEGNFKISASPGLGTRISADFPLRK